MGFLKTILRKYHLFVVNHVLVGTKTRFFESKRRHLNKIPHYHLEKGVKVVGPIFCDTEISIGENTWVGKNFETHGNGKVFIGKNCDIAPDVSIITGGHELGNHDRRAGTGKVFCSYIGSGVWLCSRTTLINGARVGDGAIIGACSLVNKDIPCDVLAAGVPAKIIKKLEGNF